MPSTTSSRTTRPSPRKASWPPPAPCSVTCAATRRRATSSPPERKRAPRGALDLSLDWVEALRLLDCRKHPGPAPVAAEGPDLRDLLRALGIALDDAPAGPLCECVHQREAHG